MKKIYKILFIFLLVWYLMVLVYSYNNNVFNIGFEVTICGLFSYIILGIIWHKVFSSKTPVIFKTFIATASIFFVILSISYLGDSVYIVNSNYKTTNGIIERVVHAKYNTYYINGDGFTDLNNVQEGDTVEVTYLPFTKEVIEFHKTK